MHHHQPNTTICTNECTIYLHPRISTVQVHNVHVTTLLREAPKAAAE